MEDLLNWFLGVWMHFILISLLDGNVFFKSDKEPGRRRPGSFDSGRPRPCWHSPTHGFSQIHQEGSQWRKTRVSKSHPVKCLKAEVWLGASWTGVFSGKVSFSFPWCPWSSLNPLDFADLVHVSRERPRIVPAPGNVVELCRLPILRHSCEKFFFKKSKEVFWAMFSRCKGVLRSEE